MARLKRLAVAGHPHYIVQRGIAGVPVFADDTDYAAYLQQLAAAASQHQVAVHAYALLPGAVHLLATPRDADGISLMMQAVGRRYVASFNRRHGRGGTLWQGRFRSAPVEAESYLLTLMRYVEQLPVRCGLVMEPADHRWSSAAHHLGRRVSQVVADHPVFWRLGNTPFDRESRYGNELAIEVGARDVAAIERLAERGWALGPPGFLSALAERAQRRAQPALRGRPRRAT